MTYAVQYDVPAPVQMYDAVHAEILKATDGKGSPGLLVHIARATTDGFQVTEVWESREHASAFDRDVMTPIIARIAGGQAPPRVEMAQEFDPRGLLLPSAGIAF